MDIQPPLIISSFDLERIEQFGRPLQLRILDVTYQPEANGDFHY